MATNGRKMGFYYGLFLDQMPMKPPLLPMPERQRPLPLQTMSPPSLTDMHPVPCNHPAPTRECPPTPPSGTVSLWVPRSCHTPPMPGCRITQFNSSHICPGIHKKVSRSGEPKRDSGTFRAGLIPPLLDQIFCKALSPTRFSLGNSPSGVSGSPSMAFRNRPTMSGS